MNRNLFLCFSQTSFLSDKKKIYPNFLSWKMIYQIVVMLPRKTMNFINDRQIKYVINKSICERNNWANMNFSCLLNVIKKIEFYCFLNTQVPSSNRHRLCIHCNGEMICISTCDVKISIENSQMCREKLFFCQIDDRNSQKFE